MRKKEKKRNITLVIVALLLVVTIGYATLTTNLTINGTSKINNSTWNVHFNNPSAATAGSVAIDTSTYADAHAARKDSATQVSFNVLLSEPGDFYEFTVEVENEGSIDAMIDEVTSTIQIGTGTVQNITSSTLPAWLNYTVTYSDGVAIATKQKLDAGTTETYKVRVEFKRDITNAQLVDAANKELHFVFGVEYVQKDNTAIAVPHDTGIYTANVFDGNTTTINNGTNTSVVWLGQAIPNGITTYQTPALAMAALKQASGGTTDRPFFLKHTISNDVVTESYVGFVISDDMVTQAQNEFITNCNNDQECIDGYQGMTAGTYYLKGKKTYEYVNDSWSCMSEYDYCIDPDYNTNKSTLLSAFGSSNCTEYSSYFSCGAAGLISSAISSGGVGAGDGTWNCAVDRYGYSGCTDL